VRLVKKPPGTRAPPRGRASQLHEYNGNETAIGQAWMEDLHISGIAKVIPGACDPDKDAKAIARFRKRM
jgi:hypothetical protein